MEGGDDDHKGRCDVCGTETPLVCENCRSSRYCSRDCQKKAWSGEHRAVCGTYKIVRAKIKPLLARGTKKEDREHMVSVIGSCISIRRPSFKANGRLRGKQLKCTELGCNEPAAVGVRYVGSKAFLSNGRISACESCFIAAMTRQVNDTSAVRAIHDARDQFFESRGVASPEVPADQGRA